jgi:hypothetical protein
VVERPLHELGDLFDAGVAPSSSHALPLPMVLKIVEGLAGGLPDGRFIGVAGEDFGLGTGLSDRVAAVVEPAAAVLNHWIRVLAHHRRAAACA